MGYSNEKISNLILKLTTQFTESRSSVWLEHYTDNVGVSSSNLLGTTLGELYVIRFTFYVKANDN